MKNPKDQNERLLRIILISWFLILILFIGGITYATVEISKIKENYAELANRPKDVVKTVQTQLQPVYTTIAGEKGDTGATGKDSVSTTTIINTEKSIPGPKGDTGARGQAGKNAREIEPGFNPETNTFYWRYVGTDVWIQYTLVSSGDL